MERDRDSGRKRWEKVREDQGLEYRELNVNQRQRIRKKNKNVAAKRKKESKTKRGKITTETRKMGEGRREW